jgi:geranylgeranyl reductase family protein
MTPIPPVLDEADVVVVGGGPGGAIAAFTLASKGHDVLLIDKQSFPREKACGDGLTSSAVSFLRQLGLDEVLADVNHIEDTRLVVDWQPRETKRSSPRASGRPQGCCLPRRTLDAGLVSCAKTAGARFLQGTVTEPILSEGNVVGVELLYNGTRASVMAHHLIIADGATSRLRRQMALTSRPRDATAYAARRYVTTQESLAHIFEIYVPLADSLAGYGWVFPVSEHVANIGIGYVTARGLPRPRSITDLLDSFLASLQRHRCSDLGSLELSSPARGAVVGLGFAVDRCEVGGVIFVGDAAHTCDPITGEGIDQAMRSAYASALALHRAIRCGRRPVGLGHLIARSNPRLGQDSAMIARLGHRLLKQRHSERSDSANVLDEPTPLFSAVRSMVGAEVDYPLMSATPAGEAASRVGFAELVHVLDNRVRDQVRSEFILCSELLHREVCAGVGPVGALMLFASQTSCGAMASHLSVDAAVSVELLRVFTTMLSRVTEASSDQAKANNALTVMISDYALSRAVGALADQGSAFNGMLANAVETSSEAIALLAQNRLHPGSLVQRYMRWTRFTTGAALSLAVRMGARLADAHQTAENALCAVGESLGIAVQICEDILTLTGEDPITGRRPRNALEEASFSLPVLLALAEDSHLAPLLVGEKESTGWDEIVGLIRRGQGLPKAAEICKRYTEQAKRAAAEVASEDSPLAVLCELPERCLAQLTSLPAIEPRVSSTVAPRMPAGE